MGLEPIPKVQTILQDKEMRILSLHSYLSWICGS